MLFCLFCCYSVVFRGVRAERIGNLVVDHAIFVPGGCAKLDTGANHVAGAAPGVNCLARGIRGDDGGLAVVGENFDAHD